MTTKQSFEWQILLSKSKVLSLRTYGDAVVDYSLYSQLLAHHNGNLRMVRELVIKEHQVGGRQTKISDVFTPCPSIILLVPVTMLRMSVVVPPPLKLNMKMAIRQ